MPHNRSKDQQMNGISELEETQKIHKDSKQHPSVDNKQVEEKDQSEENNEEFSFSSPKRMSITLPTKLAAALEKIARREQLSLNELVRRAIATDLFIQEEVNKGSKILIQKSNKEIQEVIFR